MLRILGQTNPAATTLTDVYICPSNAMAFVHRLLLCNQAGAGTFRIAVIRNLEAIALKHYVHYDTAIGANATIILENLCLLAGDKIQVYTSSATMSASALGDELPIPVTVET